MLPIQCQMMNFYSTKTKHLIVLLLLNFLAACTNNRDMISFELPGREAAVPHMLGNTVRYCFASVSDPEPTSIAVYIDASGSMIGHHREIPRYVELIKRGISRIHTSFIQMRDFKLLYFDATRGFHGNGSWISGPPPYIPAGNTNLHQAIRLAESVDLAIILTDGVGAVGSRGSDDCPDGIDASCVARALADVVHGSQGEVNYGFWLIPFIAPYNGEYFTEESIELSNINLDQIIANVQADYGVSATIQDPRIDNYGQLVYRYRGPRTLLLIILARQINVGRAIAYALTREAQYFGWYGSLKELPSLYEKGVPLFLTPIEVYPGFLEPIQWNTMSQIDNPYSFVGTFEYTFDNARNQVQWSCFKEEHAYASFFLAGNGASSQEKDCIDMIVIPSFSFEWVSLSRNSDSVFSYLISEYKLGYTGYDTLYFQLLCPIKGLPTCSMGALRTQWIARVHYEHAANCIAQRDCISELHRKIITLSTAQLSMEPHKVYTFDLLLENFLRRVSNDRHIIHLENINFCKPDGI